MKRVRIVSAACCAALGLLFPFGFIGTLFGIALLFREVWNTDDPYKALRTGVLFGVLYAAVGLSWFWDVLPLDWLGASVLSGALLTAGSWLAVCIGIGVVYGGVAVLYYYLRTQKWYDLLLFPALWVIGEYVHALAFWLVTWNTESLFGAHFSALYVGYALSSLEVVRMGAALGGIYALSFIVVLCGVFVTLLSRRVLTLLHPASVGVYLLLLFIIGYGLVDHAHPEGKVSVALVSTAFEQAIPRSETETVERKHALLDTVRAWHENGGSADIVLFPEGGKNTELSEAEARSLAHTLGSNTRLIDSGIVEDEGVLFERAFIRNTEGIVEDTYDKVFLVPQGEYTPWLAQMVLQIPGAALLRENIHRAERSYGRGRGMKTTVLENIPVGVLFCSDILSPILSKKIAESGAQIFLNPSSLAALHGSTRAEYVFLSIARIRAIEQGRFFAIASYESPATIISEKGAVLARGEESAEIALLTYDVPRLSHTTPFSRFGAWVLLVSLLTCIAIGARKILLNKRHV